MATRDPRIDAYIAKSAEFAQPILIHLRELVHAACPDVEETMKWSFPHFMYKGMIVGMASFKAHCALAFWKGSLIVDKHGQNTKAMGQFGRITSVKDLPAKKAIVGFVKQAMNLNDEGVPSPARSKPKAKKAPLSVPHDVVTALDANKKARATFDGFPPSARREYVDWITEAKTETTRARRLATAVDWMSEGKRRMWKHGAR